MMMSDDELNALTLGAIDRLFAALPTNEAGTPHKLLIQYSDGKIADLRWILSMNREALHDAPRI